MTAPAPARVRVLRADDVVDFVGISLVCDVSEDAWESLRGALDQCADRAEMMARLRPNRREDIIATHNANLRALARTGVERVLEEDGREFTDTDICFCCGRVAAMNRCFTCRPEYYR